MKEDTPRFSPAYIMAAVIPTLMISDLYFFEQKDFKLKNPSTYHYDILLLVFMVIMILCFVNLQMLNYYI
ncbi:putative bicarbonate transporter [Helianthus annuus]|nr:putative bicarbonate transporter [Helianthus annuus]